MLDVGEDMLRPLSSKEALSEMELEVICNLAIDWRKLAAALNIPPDIVQKIKKGSDRERDRCRGVLKEVPITRTKIVKILEDMEWNSLAQSLRCGCIYR